LNNIALTLEISAGDRVDLAQDCQPCLRGASVVRGPWAQMAAERLAPPGRSLPRRGERSHLFPGAGAGRAASTDPGAGG